MDGKIEKQNDNKPNNALIKKLKDIQFKLSTSDVFNTIINILIYVLFALIFGVAIYGVITLSSDVQKVFDSLTKLHKVTLDDYINIFKSHDNLILFTRFIMFSEIPLIFAALSLIFFIKKENKSWIANAIYLCLFMMLNYIISSEFFNNGAFNVESADGVGFAGPFNIAKVLTIIQIICIILALLLQVALEGCSNVELTQNDFVGIWKSPEGAYFYLNNDGTCITKNLNLSKFHYDGTDFIGKWDLKTTEAGLDCNYSLIISCDSVFFL